MLRSLYEARQQGRTDDVRTIAHRLKNTVVYLGAQPATQAILELERAAKAGELAEIDKYLSDLAEKLQSLKESLAAYYRRDTMRSNSL
jgi:hypothetical protein